MSRSAFGRTSYVGKQVEVVDLGFRRRFRRPKASKSVVNGSCPLREISKFLKFALMNSISDRSPRSSAKFPKASLPRPTSTALITLFHIRKFLFFRSRPLLIPVFGYLSARQVFQFQELSAASEELRAHSTSTRQHHNCGFL